MTAEDRINAACAQLVAEICRLPPGDRAAELRDCIDALPGVFRAANADERFAAIISASGGQ